jgi:hypothetical protein
MLSMPCWQFLCFSYEFVGHVGCPLPCCKVKLVDVPDMDYYAKDGKGEVSNSNKYSSWYCQEFSAF